MTQPFLLGPITSGSAFMIVTPEPQPLVLKLNSHYEYFWSPVHPLGNTGMAVFTASPTESNLLTITDTLNGGELGFKNLDHSLINTKTLTSVNIFQTTYAPWQLPNLFLSGVSYTLTNDQGVTGNILSDESLVPATNLYILPLIWYFGPNCQAIRTPALSLETWFCNVNQSPVCLTKRAFTQLDDCNLDFEYSYCLTGQSCGQDNCNGPCDSTQICVNTSDILACQNLPTTSVWTETWLLGTLIGLSFIIILLTLLAIFLQPDDDTKKVTS